MKPNKFEIAVQCSRILDAVLAEFSCQGKSIYDIIPLFENMYIKEDTILNFICLCFFIYF